MEKKEIIEESIEIVAPKCIREYHKTSEILR